MCPDTAGWDRAGSLISADGFIRDERFACSVPKSSPVCDELGASPRHGLHRRPTAPASAGTSPAGWGGLGVLVQPKLWQSTALPAAGAGGKT